MDIRIDFLTFSGVRPLETHRYSQFLIAMEGGMEIEIAGRASKLDEGLGAFVAPGVPHTQLADRHNRFIRLNCDPGAFDSPMFEYLANRVFLPVSPPVQHLLRYATEAQREGLPLAALSEHWTRLLVRSIVPCPGPPDSRLAKLAALVEASPDAPWTVQEMARRAAVSPSRLYALFQEKLRTTPQDWLTELRINKVRQWLAETDLSIAELAQRAGYSDQSALTRVMRRVTGLTPGAYRKQRQELWSKDQE